MNLITATQGKLVFNIGFNLETFVTFYNVGFNRYKIHKQHSEMFILSIYMLPIDAILTLNKYNSDKIHTQSSICWTNREKISPLFNLQYFTSYVLYTCFFHYLWFRKWNHGIVLKDTLLKIWFDSLIIDLDNVCYCNVCFSHIKIRKNKPELVEILKQNVYQFHTMVTWIRLQRVSNYITFLHSRYSR